MASNVSVEETFMQMRARLKQYGLSDPQIHAIHDMALSVYWRGREARMEEAYRQGYSNAIDAIAAGMKLIDMDRERGDR